MTPENLESFDLATTVLPRLERPEQLALLERLPSARVAETLGHLHFDEQYGILHHLPEAVARAVLNEMSSDDVADLLLALHARQREQLLDWLPDDYRRKVLDLMAYPENTAGSLATIDYIAVREYWTADQALAHVRKVGHEADVVYYIYVLDAPGRLVGVSSLRDVILADAQMPVSKLMKTNVIQVNADTDQEELARLLQRYDLVALPVVDQSGRLVGVVTIDDVLDVIEEETTEDVHRMAGVQPVAEPYLEAPLVTLFRKRVGWLIVLFAAQSFTSTVLRHYEDFLVQVVALALFIPLLIGMGGNTGSQASSLVIRAMALGEISPRDVMRIIWRESRLGLALGLTMGLFGVGRALLLGADGDIAITVGIAQIVIVAWASLAGATLPLLGQRLGFDPAVFSTPMLTTLVDAIGLLIYFQTARYMLGL